MEEVFNLIYLDTSYKPDIQKSIKLLSYIIYFLPVVSKSAKKTIVLDFDETIFHNARWWPIIRHIYSPLDRCTGDAIEGRDIGLPIHGEIPHLLRSVLEKGYYLHIVSSRYEKFLDVTLDNLQFYNVPIPADSIFLYKETAKTCVCRFKKRVKDELVESGYSVVLNVGDQESDLCGEFLPFRIPSFYTTPCQCSTF